MDVQNKKYYLLFPGVESHVPVAQSHTAINKSKTSQKQFLQVNTVKRKMEIIVDS